ncbi:hypothetical protein CCH79_00003944 [Gambusia affinis]|uniref:DMAP1-binding domain-containing protein n=1 Tax=Gambusia affinis TaxID=33528 RepID=A0A315V4U8_GAMAF|nr:hypothetical protein CCH79_00003944 [Gambusia affinis]
MSQNDPVRRDDPSLQLLLDAEPKNSCWGRERCLKTSLQVLVEPRTLTAEPMRSRASGDITQKGYEKKRSKLIRAYAGGMEGPMSHRAPLGPPAAARFHRRRTSGTRDERYRSGTGSPPGPRFIPEKHQLHHVHTEAVQAVLARHVERKMAVPMPSKRRSLVVQTSMDAYTPPGDSAHTKPALTTPDSRFFSDLPHRDANTSLTEERSSHPKLQPGAFSVACKTHAGIYRETGRRKL